ncbi:hypothetical protein U9M48_039041 [Paspalum notatum var. saurae]|uniref:Integrase catalytic domain-containing protein n=1 Tax=Paspalum notatum var. saurae TaxID=547442 RepID=A0AAQ3UI28_PASNO
MDTGATSHMPSSDGILLSRTPPYYSSITVGNGTSIPVIAQGHSLLPASSSVFNLNNVLVPSLVRNLLSVHQFTRDNSCSVEFDPFGFSVKDLQTRREIFRCTSSGDLYTFPAGHSSIAHAHLAVPSTVWHQRLGHPAPAAIAHYIILESSHYTLTQFGLPIKCLQADNGREFVNNATASFLASRGTLLRLSCPYTSPQNGKAERIIRTLNNSTPTLLLHASMPPKYWAEALATAAQPHTSLIGVRPPAFTIAYLSNSFMACSLTSSIFVCLVACAILIFPLLLPTNLLLAQQHASSLVIPPLIRAIDALTLLLSESFCLAMLSLMRLFFPSLLPPLRFLLSNFLSLTICRFCTSSRQR